MPTTQVAFRLPNDLLERVDAHAERLRRDVPGIDPTRADVVRVLLVRALEAVEQTEKRKK